MSGGGAGALLGYTSSNVMPIPLIDLVGEGSRTIEGKVEKGRDPLLSPQQILALKLDVRDIRTKYFSHVDRVDALRNGMQKLEGEISKEERLIKQDETRSRFRLEEYREKITQVRQELKLEDEYIKNNSVRMDFGKLKARAVSDYFSNPDNSLDSNGAVSLSTEHSLHLLKTYDNKVQ